MKNKFLSIALALSILLSFMPIISGAASGSGTLSDGSQQTDSSGNKINISNTEINSNTLSFTVELSTDNSIQGTILAVVYDSEGVITNVKSYPAKKIMDITFTNQTDIRYVKVFWQYDRSMPFLTSDCTEILSEDLKPIPTQEPPTTPDVTWKLEDGVLTISGTGKMDDYDYEDNPDIRYAPWYDDRETIKSVIIEDGVTSIGNYAFYFCRNLTSITIPDSVITIGTRAFYFCKNLTSITIPDSVTTIDFGAFDTCTGLTSITIPDGVTTIGDCAFYRCTSLTSITIPDSVINIGLFAFSLCHQLRTVYYTGSKDKWNTISIGSKNTYLTDANIIYNYNGR